MSNSYKVAEYKKGEQVISLSFMDYPLDRMSCQEIIDKVNEIFKRELA